MARVNVEEKALTDPRFGFLGVLLMREELGDAAANDVTTETARCVGIGRMCMVWNACAESASYNLPDTQLFILLGTHKGAEFLIECDLAVRVSRKSLRIKGTIGRTDWLGKKRVGGEKGAAFGQLGAGFGKLGGRPSKNPPSDSTETGVRGVSDNPPKTPPPAPAPAPAIEDKKKKRASLLAEDWQPKQRTRDWAAKKYPRVDFDAELETFRDWHIGKGSRWVDWDRALQTWIRNAKPTIGSPFDRTKAVV